MDESEKVMVKVVRPVEYSVFGSDVVERWVKFTHVRAVELIANVLLEHGFDGKGPGSVEEIKE